MALVENLVDLVRMEVLEDTGFVDASQRGRLEREVEDARLRDPARVRVVPGIEPQRPLGDVDGGHSKPLVEARVHLSAAASRVEAPRARGERSLRVPAKVTPDHAPIHGGAEAVDRPG